MLRINIGRYNKKRNYEDNGKKQIMKKMKRKNKNKKLEEKRTIRNRNKKYEQRLIKMNITEK